MSLKSRFKIGQSVLFQPNLKKLNFTTNTCEEGTLSKVVAIKFDSGKVLYDLAVAGADFETVFYEGCPICNIDSVMVCPLN